MMVWEDYHGMLFDWYAIVLLCMASSIAWLLMSMGMPLVGAEMKPTVGSWVQAVFYTSSSKYNGMVGLCERWNVQMERWEVRLESTGELKIFKPKNLVVVEPPSKRGGLLSSGTRGMNSVRSNDSRGSNSSRESTNSQTSQFSRTDTTTVIGDQVYVRQPSSHSSLFPGNRRNSPPKLKKSKSQLTVGQEPGVVRPNALLQTGNEAFGQPGELKRILWRQLIFAVVASGSAILLMVRAFVAAEPELEVVDGLTWWHQLVFTVAAGHWLNMLWEDCWTANFSAFNSYGVPMASLGMGKYFGDTRGVLAAQSVQSTAILAFFLFVLATESLGGIGVQVLLLEAPNVLVLCRQLAFLKHTPPFWMRRLRLVAWYWRSVIFLLAVSRGLLVGVWIWKCADIFRGHCGLICGAADQLMYCFVGAVVVLFGIRQWFMVRGYYSVDMGWARNFSRSARSSEAYCCIRALIIRLTGAAAKVARTGSNRSSNDSSNSDPSLNGKGKKGTRVSTECSLTSSMEERERQREEVAGELNQDRRVSPEFVSEDVDIQDRGEDLMQSWRADALGPPAELHESDERRIEDPTEYDRIRGDTLDSVLEVSEPAELGREDLERGAASAGACGSDTQGQLLVAQMAGGVKGFLDSPGTRADGSGAACDDAEELEPSDNVAHVDEGGEVIPSSETLSDYTDRQLRTSWRASAHCKDEFAEWETRVPEEPGVAEVRHLTVWA